MIERRKTYQNRYFVRITDVDGVIQTTEELSPGSEYESIFYFSVAKSYCKHYQERLVREMQSKYPQRKDLSRDYIESLTFEVCQVLQAAYAIDSVKFDFTIYEWIAKTQCGKVFKVVKLQHQSELSHSRKMQSLSMSHTRDKKHPAHICLDNVSWKPESAVIRSYGNCTQDFCDVYRIL